MRERLELLLFELLREYICKFVSIRFFHHLKVPVIIRLFA